jgi:colanic acid/amylovoran biosynthesis glycosyltransferase
MSGRFRVAYVLGTFPALTETFVLRELSGLRHRGIDVMVCAIRRPAVQQLARLASLGNDLVCTYARPDSLARHAWANVATLVHRPSRYYAGFRMFLREAMQLPPREALQLLYHFFAGIGFGHELQRAGVTHLHCHFNSSTNMGLAAHLVRGVEFSFTAHASADLFMRPALLAEKVARAQFVVPVCEYSKNFLDSITSFHHSDKLHRIYNGVEHTAFAGSPVDVSSTSSTTTPAERLGRRVVSVGSLVEAKGHATLIQVCSMLRSLGRDLCCRIIGEGPERATLERLIRRYKLQDCVELVGALPLDRVYAELRQADVFVLLSEIGRCGYRDGFPTAILEAMAAGLPVLSTSLSGIPEMVLDGVTGILVRERDVQAASEALDRLLQSDELRQSMGRRGQARTRELFDADHSVDELATLLTGRAELATLKIPPVAGG